MKENNTLLSWSETQSLLAGYGLRVSGEVAQSPSDAGRNGFPVVLKGYSTVNSHKSEYGLVRLGLENQTELDAAFVDLKELMSDWDGINEIVVQPNLGKGMELVLGARQDGTFGPVIMFGLGGTLVEVLQDVVFGLAPLDNSEALRLIDRLRCHELLDGYRGMPAVNRQELAEILTKLSKLIYEHPEIQELDLNPVTVTPQGLQLIDIRAVKKEV